MTEHKTLKLMLGAMLVAGMAIVAIWLPFSTVDMAPSTIHSIGRLAVFVCVLIALSRYIDWRLEADASSIAHKIKYASKSMAYICYSVVGLTCINILILSAAYLGAASAFPLIDNQLAQFSTVIGFDWSGLLEWTNGYPLLMKSLYWAYTSTLIQTPILVFMLAALHQRDRLLEYASLYIITSLIVALFAVLTPALGAYSYYQPDLSLYSAIGSGPATAHLDMTNALRGGETMLIDFDKPVGIVTFPSFHTVLAIITTWCARDLKYIFPPLLALNIWVIVSTLPVGGHYLIDLPAGAAVAYAAIWLTKRMMVPANAESEADGGTVDIADGAVRA